MSIFFEILAIVTITWIGAYVYMQSYFKEWKKTVEETYQDKK